MAWTAIALRAVHRHRFFPAPLTCPVDSFPIVGYGQAILDEWNAKIPVEDERIFLNIAQLHASYDPDGACVGIQRVYH